MSQALKARCDSRLRQSFFEQPTLTLARKLLGKTLVTNIDHKITSGMIVEVEAYQAQGDLASHSAKGPTARNKVMFMSAGHCYVYLIYGLHYCVNVVSEAQAIGSAVLIRALQPLQGIDVMQQRRGMLTSCSAKQLTNGPGKLCQALAITKAQSAEHFATSSSIWIERYRTIPDSKIKAATRIGISKSTEHEWRFYI